MDRLTRMIQAPMFPVTDVTTQLRAPGGIVRRCGKV